MDEIEATLVAEDPVTGLIRLAAAAAPRLEGAQAPPGCVAIRARELAGHDPHAVARWLHGAGGYATFGYFPVRAPHDRAGASRGPLQPERILVLPSAALRSPAPAA